MIRSLRSREKMSNARSPRAVCSTTIGISAIGYLLAAFASMIALCAAWQRHDTPASVGRSDKREHVYADTEEIPPSLFGKRAGYFAPFPAVQVSMVRSWSARRRSRSSGSRRMPRDSPIAPRMVLISLSDFLPKFLVLSRSDSVFCTSSAMVWICAVLRQLDARTDSSSSSTLRNRCSLTSRRTMGAAPVSAPSISAGGACGKSTSSANWSSRMRAASATAVSGVTLPVVQTSRISRSCEADGRARGSTWKFTRVTGEKSASISMALTGRGSGSRFSAGWYPRPCSTQTSSSRLASRSSVATTPSSVRSSTSGSRSKSRAMTVRPPLHLEPQELGPVDVHREDQLAKIENDVEDVLPHPGQVRELVQHVLDLDPGRGGAGDGGQQHPAVGGARGHGEARLEGLDGEFPVAALTDEPVVTDRKGELLHAIPPERVGGPSPYQKPDSQGTCLTGLAEGAGSTEGQPAVYRHG